MRGRYLGRVGQHKPCVPELLCALCARVVMRVFVPVWDRLCFATTVAAGAFGRHGATHDLA